MKKITKIITIGILFLSMPKIAKAYQVNINRGKEIPNVTVHIKTEEKEFNQKIYQNYRFNESEALYTLDYENILKESISKKDDHEWKQISEEKKKEIEKIVFFGYQYENRTDLKWYVATQYLIWDYLLSDNGEIYFIDENNEKIDLYKEEREEIRKDVEELKTFPSFVNNQEKYNLKLGKDFRLIDENNVLENCELGAINIEMQTLGNQLILKGVGPGLGKVKIRRIVNSNNIREDFTGYVNDNSQVVVFRGHIEPEEKTMDIDIAYPVLNIEIENKYNNPKGIKYELQNIDKEDDIKEIILDEFGKNTIENVEIGSYVLKEIEVPTGYELTNEEVSFEVKEAEVTLTMHPKEIKKTSSTSYQGISEELEKKEETTYEIYDQNKKLIQKEIADEKGYIKMDSLQNGIYYIKEEGKEEFYKFKKESNNKMNLNQLKRGLGSLIIEKINPRNNSPMTGYRLGLYDQNKKLIQELVTNYSFGRAHAEELPAGIYYIRELSDYGKILESDLKIEIAPGIETKIELKDRINIKVPITSHNRIPYFYILSTLLLFLGIKEYAFKKE